MGKYPMLLYDHVVHTNSLDLDPIQYLVALFIFISSSCDIQNVAYLPFAYICSPPKYSMNSLSAEM